MLNHVKGTRHNHLKVIITLNQIIVAKIFIFLFDHEATRFREIELII